MKNLNLKRLFAVPSNQKGFVLVEFVIALPLLILLIYALGNMTVQTLKFSQKYSAEHVLESEAQYVIERISHSARAAKKVIIEKAVGNKEIYKITFYQHVLGNGTDTKRFFKNTKASSNIADAIDLLDTRFYTVHAPNNQAYRIYAERQPNGRPNNPITGNSFLGDTTVTQLKFIRDGKVLHITLELQSLETERKFKVSTAIFMPGYEDE